MTTLLYALRTLRRQHHFEQPWDKRYGIPAYTVGKRRELDLKNLIDAWERKTMPRKNQQQRDNLQDTWFANIRLTERDRVAYESWLNSLDDKQAVSVDLALQQGWKLSVSFSMDNDGYVASATMKDVKDVNAGAVITSWSGDWYDALMTTIYKIVVLVDESTIERDDKGVRWG